MQNAILVDFTERHSEYVGWIPYWPNLKEAPHQVIRTVDELRAYDTDRLVILAESATADQMQLQYIRSDQRFDGGIGLKLSSSDIAADDVATFGVFVQIGNPDSSITVAAEYDWLGVDPSLDKHLYLGQVGILATSTDFASFDDNGDRRQISDQDNFIGVGHQISCDVLNMIGHLRWSGTRLNAPPLITDGGGMRIRLPYMPFNCTESPIFGAEIIDPPEAPPSSQAGTPFRLEFRMEKSADLSEPARITTMKLTQGKWEYDALQEEFPAVELYSKKTSGELNDLKFAGVVLNITNNQNDSNNNGDFEKGPIGVRIQRLMVSIDDAPWASGAWKAGHIEEIA